VTTRAEQQSASDETAGEMKRCACHVDLLVWSQR
jgi:hypothetical protein